MAERLAELFAAYLGSGRAPEAATRLAPALAAAGYALEAAALLASSGPGATPASVELPGSAWHARRLWTGAQLPSEAGVGDVWLDTCQLTPMLLAPREDDADAAYAWIDLRPLHNWQYAAFLALARMTPRVVQLEPPLPLFDSARAPRGVPTDAVTDVVPDEARLCASWFGKAMCGLYAWQSARAFLPPPAFDALWGEPAREWAGEWDEGAFLAVAPATIDRDPDLEDGSDVGPSAEERTLFGEWAHSPGITFRGCVLVQLGLLSEPSEDGAWWLPSRLVSRAPR